SRGRRRHQARMGDTGERDSGDVTRACGLSLEIPYGLVRVGELVDEKGTPVTFREDTGVPPALTGERTRILLRERPHVQNVNDQQITWFRTADPDRSGERVDLGHGRVADVLGRVVVLDGAVEPLAAVHPEGTSGTDAHGGRNIRVVPIVAGHLLVGERF